jgi:hypothetical protein
MQKVVGSNPISRLARMWLSVVGFGTEQGNAGS